MDLQAILDSADSSSSSSASLFSGDGKQLRGGDHNTRGYSGLLSSSNPSNSNSIGSYNDSYRGGIRGGGDGGGIGIGSEDAVDLEQILREDDEEDDDDEDGVSSSTSGGGGGTGYMYDRRQRRLDDEELLRPKRLSSSRRMSSLSASHNSLNSSNSSNPEEWDILQAILGEDDDDNDDSGDDNYNGDNYDHGSEYRSEASSSHRHAARVYYGSENDENDDDDDDILVSSSSSRRHRQQRQSKNSANDVDRIRNNKEVDIILQQSDDEYYGNENDDYNDEYGTRSSNKLRRRTYLDNNNNNNNDDDDDLVDIANVDSFMTAMQSEDSSEQLSNNKNDAINDNDNNYTIATATSNEYSNSTYYVPAPISSTKQQQTLPPPPPPPPPPTPKRRNQSNADNNNTRQNKNNNVLFAKSDTELEKASLKALQVARAREAKLLKSTREARDNIVSPLTVKRRLKPKIELNTKMQQRQKELLILQQKEQQQQQKQQSKKSSSNKAATSNNNSNGPHFNFSGNVISMKQMQSVSKSLIKRCCESNDDLPTAVGINSRFICVGTQKGAILVYDHFEVLRQKLGGYYAESKSKGNNNSTSSGDNNNNNNNAGGGDSNFNPKIAGSVTTVDLSLVQCEFLAAGYTGGNIVLWDVIKGIALKSLVETTPYPSPIVSVRFFASELKLVTVDAGGLVNKLNFSKNMLWSTYSVESECLLDGTAGQILAMNVLPPYQYVRQQLIQQASNNGNTAAAVQTKSLRSTMKKLVLIALSSERNSFVVAVEPSVHVLHRWLKPEPERIMGIARRQNQPERQAQVYLPCLSWGWALVNGGGHVINPILARAWGCCIQLLSASFPDSDEGGGGPTTNTTKTAASEGFQYPAFGVHDEFDVDVPVVALEWLNDRSLVYLSMNNEFTVVDTVMMTLLERLDFSGLQLVYAEFSLSRKVTQKVEQKKPSSEAEYDSDNDDENSGVVESQAAPAPVKAGTYFCTTFQNSFRSCDKRLMLLCQEEVQSVSVVEARPRISGLENDGEWLEALALALDHYENTIKSQEDRKRDPKGYKDLSKHPGLRNGDGRTEDEEWIAKLLIRYLNIAVENAPETTNDFNFPPEIRQSQMDLARSHFQMLAGVCIEFCVVTKRLDLLFGPIFRRFHAADVLSVFLDVLEPYILNDKLDYIAPEAMMHFVEHCRTNNGIATVERCLLHMDVTIMDFDTILNLLRANEMYSALFYIYNQGLNDYTTPLEILCESIFDAADTVGQLTNERRIDGISQNDFERFGYKAILYLQSTFRGRYFPKETEMAEECLHTVRPQLLRFLLQSRYAPSRNIKSPTQVIGQRALRYPYAHILLMVDPKAMFDTLSTAMDAPDEEFRHNESNGIESIGGWEVEVGADTRSTASSTDSTSTPDRQEIIRMLLSIMMPSKDDITITHQTTLYRSQSAVNAFLDFLADYLMRGVIRTDKSVTFMILKRMATRFAVARDSEERKKWQGQIISLLSALPRSSYDSDAVLELVEKNGIHRASLLLHQEEASAWPHGDMTMERRGTHFCAAIDCYLDDDDPEYRKEVFSYVKKECSGASDEKDEQPNTLRNALISKLVDLVLLDALMTAELAADLFVDDPDQVIRSLDDEEAKFMFLKAVISGELNEMDSVAGSVLNTQLTMEHHHQYMALMVKLHPELVYDYLSTHDNYRTEECLQLCQKYDIADASAYLLERMGNVTSALQLILQTMESRMMNLKRTIRGMGTDHFDKYYPRLSKHSRIPKRDRRLNPELYGKQEKEIDGLKRILTVALDVCERNSGSFSSRKETEHGSQLWFNVLDRLINAKGFLRLSKEQSTHAKVMAGVLSELLRLTMQRMVSSVPLPDLVRKVTSDHSGSRLGELREMIESLLITYGLELDVFGGAVSVFHFDSQQMEKYHHALRVRGSNVQSVMSIAMDNKSSSSAKAMTRFRNNNEILQLGRSSSHRDANTVVSTNPSSSHQRSRTSNNSKQERGLGDALSRLRSRRRDTNKNGDNNNNTTNNTIRSASEMNNNNTRIRKATTGLNLMTSNEMAYRRGEISADATYFEDRQVGLLGEAEHRGRIMSFMY